MRILVLGGTGAIGFHVCRLLAEAGYEVVVTSRRQRDSNVLGISYVVGNAKRRDFLDAVLCERWDAVLDFMVWSTAEFRERCESFLSSAEQYLFVSSYRVYADSSVITEDSPRLLDVINDPEYLATDEYALAKARCENMLFESGRSNWTIVRPAITYDGGGRLQLGVMESEAWLARAVAGIPVPFPREMLSKQATMSGGGDVARMIAALVGNPQAYGESFTVSSSDHMSWSDVAETYRTVLPFDLVEVALSDYERIYGAAYQIRYDRMCDRVIDNGKILRATGILEDSLVSMRDGLAGALRDFLATDSPFPVRAGLSGRLDRLVGGFPSLGGVSKDGIASLAKYLARRFG
ncbi:MAG: NAD-dependent epimerase/dehydratase family protein [Eggerthella lenta]|nr:NAD-dependent epimerase/dehydratase family protein [Eggerthella lenta]